MFFFYCCSNVKQASHIQDFILNLVPDLTQMLEFCWDQKYKFGDKEVYKIGDQKNWSGTLFLHPDLTFALSAQNIDRQPKYLCPRPKFLCHRQKILCPIPKVFVPDQNVKVPDLKFQVADIHLVIDLVCDQICDKEFRSQTIFFFVSDKHF